MIKNKNFKLLLFPIFLFSFFSLIFFNYSYLQMADCYLRILSSQEPLTIIFKNFINGGAWLPLHFLILGIPLKIINQPLIIPRLTTLFVSVLTLIPFYLIIVKVFHSQKTALIALFLISTLRFFLYIASQTYSESIFIFFFLWAIFFFLQKKYKLFIVFFNLSSMIRYEVWFLIPFLGFFFYLKEKKIKTTLLIIFFLCLFPLYWIIINSLKNNHPLPIIEIKLYWAKLEPSPNYWSLPLSIIVWCKSFLRAIPNYLWLFFIISLLRIKSYKIDHFFILAIVIIIFLSLVFQVYFATMEYFPERYLIISIYLIIPFISYGIYSFYKFLKFRGRDNYLSFVFMMAAIVIINLLFTFNSFKSIINEGNPNNVEAHKSLIQDIIKKSNKEKVIIHPKAY